MSNAFGSLKNMESSLKERKRHCWNAEDRDINHRILSAERKRPAVKGQGGDGKNLGARHWG